MAYFEVTADFERKIKLVTEACYLSHIINRARFEEVIPSDEVTVRLCSILNILADDINAA